MKNRKFKSKLRPTPAQDLARAAVMRLIAEGHCIIRRADLASIANISESTAQEFLRAGAAVGLFQKIHDRIPIAHTDRFVITEKFPGAPSAETVTLGALIRVADSGMGTTAAFAYHTALMLHGLTEVAPTGLHVVKMRLSIHTPALPDDTPYVPRTRLPREWMRLEDGRPVWLTLRSASQLTTADLVTVHREQMALPVTSGLRTLVDAWMHPDWCGGMDRVADSWRMYWRTQDIPIKRAELTSLLASTTWPGLWKPLSAWARTVIPALDGLREMTEKAVARGR